MLSCFHGPQVDGSFNTMGDVIDPKSCRMNVEVYSAIQTVKYGWRAVQKTAIEKFTETDYLHEKVDTTLHKSEKFCFQAQSPPERQVMIACIQNA